MTIHKEKRVIHHRPQDLYALVADVRSYPEFLPWCLASRIRQESIDSLTADLIIGFNMFRERFTSYVELDPATLEITVKYAEGPFLKQPVLLELEWDTYYRPRFQWVLVRRPWPT
mgnify:CR=1 FL=1